MRKQLRNFLKSFPAGFHSSKSNRWIFSVESKVCLHTCISSRGLCSEFFFSLHAIDVLYFPSKIKALSSVLEMQERAKGSETARMVPNNQDRIWRCPSPGNFLVERVEFMSSWVQGFSANSVAFCHFSFPSSSLIRVLHQIPKNQFLAPLLLAAFARPLSFPFILALRFAYFCFSPNLWSKNGPALTS